MVNIPQSATRITLLGRLRRDPGDQEAWREFVDHYGTKIMGWCLKWRMQEADAQDVTQNVLLKLAQKMRDFQYDPARSFRAWLKRIVQNACSDFVENRNRAGLGSGDSQIGQLLHQTEAREDLLKHLEEEFDREIMQEAMFRVRLRVAPQTWQAFQLTAIEGLAGADAAERIPMQVAQVYVAKRRVQKMLQEEVAKLDGAEGEEAPDDSMSKP